ncbi:uncharacterized protein LOC124493282 isoform X1 [Dermatophagoides farinae]|uniref:uncharacterized protein LOC124493282 isoform X1 n=1 Tax=Dermatophagoides farinae TaxID=6954 RepID=UPI003F5E3D19
MFQNEFLWKKKMIIFMKKITMNQISWNRFTSLTIVSSIIFMVIIENFTIVQSLTLGSYCNPLNGCDNETLICYNYQCVCAPGYNPTIGDSNVHEYCQQYDCHNDQNCSSEIDPYRKCNLSKKKCIDCQHGMFLSQKRQRCVSYLGQSCLNDLLSESELRNQSLVCRNGVLVCRPNHYPDEQWTHCRSKSQNCLYDYECQMFSDYYRICHRSKHSNRSRCICDQDSRENPHTLQCIFIGPTFSSFLMMPFFLLPMCLMIVIIAYVGHRLFRSSQSPRTSTSNHSNSSRNNHSTTRTHRRQRRNVTSSLQPDPTKTPSALSRMDLNDLPPSYDIVLREQQRIQDEISQQQPNDQQQVGCSTSTTSQPSTSILTTTRQQQQQQQKESTEVLP